MGDRVSIPRSFSDSIGVADVLPSIRRHYIPLYHGELTTGMIWPLFDADTTGAGANGVPMFQRNFQAERLFMFAGGISSDAATTVHQVDIMAGGTTVGRVGGRFWSGTSTRQAIAMSTTPMNANIAAGAAIRIVGVRKLNLANSAQITLVGRERLDG
jgi:hypothetical protein